MKMRSVLLAGVVLPLALACPAFAVDVNTATPGTIVIAQADELLLPEGAPVEAEAAQDEEPAAKPKKQKKRQQEAEQQESAPVEEAPAAEIQPVQDEEPAAKPKKAKKPKPQQEAEQQETAPIEEAPAAEIQPVQDEEPAAKPKKAKKPKRQQEAEQQESAPVEEAPAAEAIQPVQDEEPAAKPDKRKDRAAERKRKRPEPAEEQTGAPESVPVDEAAGQPGAEGENAATGLKGKDNALERARRRQQELKGQAGAPDEAPAADPAPDTAEGRPVDQPGIEATDAVPVEVAPMPESTVEQQLEAQGDTEKAEQVRNLRQKLRRERRESDVNREDDPGEDVATDTASEDGQGDERRRRRDRDGSRGKVVEERGDRIIVDLGGGNIFVEPTVPDEGERLLYDARDVEVEDLPRGRTRTIVYRENGSQIVTVRNRYGDIVTRTRVTPNGREVVLIDNRYTEEDDEAPAPILFEADDLPPLVIGVPDDEYIVDLGRASDQQIQDVLLAPPVEKVERAYTLDEVTRNERIRDKMSRIDLDTITFEFGSSTISNSQMGSLNALGQAMEQVITANPDEVYLIEGYTDAVGSGTDNLILSGQRAEAVAVALSQNFEIPPENLVTEGYGEQYLKVETDGPEQQNRRVTARRITPLLSAQAQQ